MSENKNTPKSTDLINKKAIGKAFLKRLAYGKDTYASNSLGFNYDQKKSDYTAPQDSSQFDLWVTEVNFGYTLVGSNAASRFYNKFYPQYFRKNPVQIKGVCRDEAEYNYLAKFIREQQVNATLDHNNLLLLVVPAAGIKAIGVIPEFQAGISTQNLGIPVAPEFAFEFIVFRDLLDSIDADPSKSLLRISAFESNRNRQIIDDPSLPAIFSKDKGTVKPYNPPNKPNQPPSNNTNTINSAANGAKGNETTTVSSQTNSKPSIGAGSMWDANFGYNWTVKNGKVVPVK